MPRTAPPAVKRLRGARVNTPDGLRRGLGSPALFGIVQGFVAASLYFAVGVVAERALGLTWVVFLAGFLLFTLIMVSYVEGASLHQERGGATVIARYAFNELWSFVAGWAICLDYLILIALTAFAISDYAAIFWAPLASGFPEFCVGFAVIAYVTVNNVRGMTARRYDRAVVIVLVDLVLQIVLVVLGMALLFEPQVLTHPAAVTGKSVSLGDLLWAFPLVLVAFSGIDASSGLSGQVAVGPQGAQAARRGAAHRHAHPVRGDRARRLLDAAGGARGGGRPGVVDRGADARRRRRLPAADPARRPALPGGDLGDRDPDRGLPGGDARPLAARLLARAQPPDPVAGGLPAPALRHAGGGDRHRLGAGDDPADPGQPQAAAGHLRLRHHGRVHDGLPLGLPAALEGARRATARTRSRSTSASAAPSCRSRPPSAPCSARWRWSPCSSTTAAGAGSASAGWPSGSASTSSTASPRASR